MADVLPHDLVLHPVERDVPRELAALCDVADLALRAVEARGELTDDRPDLALATLRRWCERECSVEELDAAAEAASEAWSAAFGSPAERAFAAVDWLCLAAQDELAAVDDESRRRVIDGVRDALVALGERRDAAGARVSAAYRAALRRRR
jgi:hypothetical protein